MVVLSRKASNGRRSEPGAIAGCVLHPAMAPGSDRRPFDAFLDRTTIQPGARTTPSKSPPAKHGPARCSNRPRADSPAYIAPSSRPSVPRSAAFEDQSELGRWELVIYWAELPGTPPGRA